MFLYRFSSSSDDLCDVGGECGVSSVVLGDEIIDKIDVEDAFISFLLWSVDGSSSSFRVEKMFLNDDDIPS